MMRNKGKFLMTSIENDCDDVDEPDSEDYERKKKTTGEKEDAWVGKKTMMLSMDL